MTHTTNGIRTIGFTIPLITLLLVGVTGCTSSATHPHPTSSGPTATPPPAVAPAVTKITHKPGTNPGYVGALKDVKITTCHSDKPPAQFAGTVTNSTSDSQNYRIYVSLLAAGKTLGVREIDIPHLEAKTTTTWSGNLAAGKTGTQCVLRVERTTP